MKKQLGRFGLIAGISGLMMFSNALPACADDVQRAYQGMQQALTEYRDAVVDQADQNLVRAKRDAYFVAKSAYEKLTRSAGQLSDKAKAAVQNTSATATKSAAATTDKAYVREQAASVLTTAGGIERTINKAVTGAKVTEKDLDISFKETDDNSLELQTGEAFWQSVTKDLKAAQKSITIQMFGMEADKTGWEFAKLLAEKAKQGVEVMLVAHRVGARMGGAKNLISTTEEEKLFAFYKQNGIKVVFYDRVSKATSVGQKLDFFHFDHRKKFIIDGQIGYVGGYTLQQESREKKHDMMVRCQGSVVGQMQSGLLLSFLYNGGKLASKDAATLRDKFFPKPAKTGASNARITYNIPRGVHDVHDDYKQQIDSAKDYLYVINPYITNNDLIDRLAAAARRGVDVRLVHPGSAENPLNDANTRFHFEKLQKAGVKIYMYQGEKGLGKVHAKGLIADDKFASIGSCNMDTMALRHNYESNVASKDPEFVRQVRKDLFEKDFAVSKLYEPPKSLWERIKLKVKGGAAELLDRWD
ncbi:MAG TPA: hypothetical protein DCG57_12015 [Candidatus Riflebacteria bacterium]|nr:hypothetical protein [Candidatus Riflebacteria bacterium]